jgi:hypothetical protein
MALELRPNCEYCDVDLPPQSTEARICSYECTFCSTCVETKLQDVCPNCGGGFALRPIRPAQAWRAGVSLADQPPSTERRRLAYDVGEIAAFSERVRGVLPPER